MGELAEMGLAGDTKTTWNPRNPDEVEAAQTMFNKLIERGFRIYKVSEEGKAAEIMRTFEPMAGKLIAVPRVVGG